MTEALSAVTGASAEFTTALLSGADADEVVCAELSSRFSGISQCYDDFHQVSDDEVSALLAAGGPA